MDRNTFKERSLNGGWLQCNALCWIWICLRPYFHFEVSAFWRSCMQEHQKIRQGCRFIFHSHSGMHHEIFIGFPELSSFHTAYLIRHVALSFPLLLHAPLMHAVPTWSRSKQYTTVPLLVLLCPHYCICCIVETCMTVDILYTRVCVELS